MDRFESAQAQTSASQQRNQSTNSRKYGAFNDINHLTPQSDDGSNHAGSKMRHLMRIIIDFAVLLMVASPILAFSLWVEPYKRGFFCYDDSLMYPSRDSTIKPWMLFLIVALPVVLILVTESVRAKSHKTLAKINLQLFYTELPSWIIEACGQIGIFVFGMMVCELATDIAKYSIGRYRPDFLSVCQPNFTNGSTCSNAINYGRYIEDFSCSTGIDNQILKDLRLSFPSSHASFSAYTMVYVVIRMKWGGSKLFKHFLQFAVLMMALFISLSRISDNKHHWSDVLAGLFVGVAVALLVTNFIAGLGRPEPRKYLLEPGYQSRPQLSAAV